MLTCIGPRIGSHPVTVLIWKVADLASVRRSKGAGSVFYASVIRFLYTICQAFPSIYLSTVINSLDYLDLPSAIIDFVGPSSAGLLFLPLEIIDYIFRFVPQMELLRTRLTCRRWCQIATRLTHVHLVLWLSPDWQVSLSKAGGVFPLMDEYALAQYVAVTYFVVYWGIEPYVLSVTYINWLCLCVCFFYHLLPNVSEFMCRSEGCAPRNITSISTPFILPPLVMSVRLFKCSLKYHALERLCRRLLRLDTLELSGVLYGHMVCISVLYTCSIHSVSVHV